MRSTGWAAAAVVAASLVGVAHAAGSGSVYPARVQVAADEFHFGLSRAKIVSGPVILQLANFGEDPHDLRFRRAGGTRTYAIKETLPGDDRDLQVKLLPGRFTLWCSIADHRQRGMQATLLVVKPPT
jgi:hypothetical protein